jgi:hypothetical protein
VLQLDSEIIQARTLVTPADSPVFVELERHFAL